MSKLYETEDEIAALVKRFENGTIPRGEWNHAGHLTAALYYCRHDEPDAALAKMRANLLHHLQSIGIDLTKEMPYHETLTVFWMRAVDDFQKSKKGASLPDLANELIEKFDKDYPFRFYSRERLFSDAARARFVEPDLQADLDEAKTAEPV